MSSRRGKLLKRLGLIAGALVMVITTLLFILWQVGGQMATHHAETVIASPPEQVFPFLIEGDRLKQWMTGLVESKALTEGGPRVGAKSQEVVEEDGRRMVFLSEITQYEVNRLLVVKLENDMFAAVSTYEVEVTGDGTRVKHRFEARYKGMMRFMGLMIGGMVQKKLEGDMQRLKEVAERELVSTEPHQAEYRLTRMETDDAIADLVHAFEACTLPKARWTHHAHLTTALWYLRRVPREEATDLLRTNIQRYNRTIGGSPDGYHETITLAWIAVITRFLFEHDQGQPQAELTRKLIAACGDKDYLLRYYRRETLMGDAPRRGWIGPDLQPISDS